MPAVRHYSDTTAQRIDTLVQRLIETTLEHSISILRARRSALERGAALLLRQETLSEDQLLALASERAEALA